MDIETRGIILYRQQKTKALIRLADAAKLSVNSKGIAIDLAV